MRLIIDAGVGMPDEMTPAFRRKPEAERIGPDHIDVVTSRRLAPDDFPRTFDAAGVADPHTIAANSEHGSPG